MRQKRGWNLESKIRSALRRVWLYSPERANALKGAKARGTSLYICLHCKRMSPKKDVQVDHVEACGSIKEHGYDEWIRRLFDGKLQVLCRDCHGIKGAFERKSIRRMPRA